LLFTTDSVGCSVRIDSMMGLSHERLLSSLEHTKGEYDTVRVLVRPSKQNT